MSEVTRNMPITAMFDGCFCNTDCEMYRGRCFKQVGWIPDDVDESVSLVAHILQNHTPIRTKWCCEIFGYGDDNE